MTKKIKAIGTSLLYMGIYLSFQAIYLTVASFMFGLKNRGLEADKFTEDLNQMLSTNSLLAIVFSTVFSLLMYYQMCKNKKISLIENCSFHKISYKNIGLSVLGGIAFLFINGYIVGLIRYFGLLKRYMIAFEEFSSDVYSTNIVLMIISVGIVAPFIEEVIFRGLIVNELRVTMNIKAVIIVQAILFGIFHLRVIQMVYATLLGLFLGIVFVKTKSLWAPVILHISYNITSILVSNYGQDTIFTQYQNYFFILSFITVTFIIIYMIKNKSSNEEIII